MFDKKSFNRAIAFSSTGIVAGGVSAKILNKNIFLGCVSGLFIGIASVYALYYVENKINKLKPKSSAGGKTKVAL